MQQCSDLGARIIAAAKLAVEAHLRAMAHSQYTGRQISVGGADDDPSREGAPPDAKERQWRSSLAEGDWS